MLEYENSKNPYLIRKAVIADFLKNASEYVTPSKETVNAAIEISRSGIRAKDAAHLACAIQARCDYFITTDDRLLKYKDDRIRIINPVDFVIMGEGDP